MQIQYSLAEGDIDGVLLLCTVCSRSLNNGDTAFSVLSEALRMFQFKCPRGNDSSKRSIGTKFTFFHSPEFLLLSVPKFTANLYCFC